MTTFEFTFNVHGEGDDEESAWDEAQNRMPLLLSDAQSVTNLSDEPTTEAVPLKPNWFYPLHATCRVCDRPLQFDIDPNGTPGQNGDWGDDGDYGCITGDEDGTDGHTPINIRWTPST